MTRHYLIVANVEFTPFQSFIDRATGRTTKCRGCVQKLGVSISLGESINDAVESLVEGKINWNETTIDEVNFESLDDELRKGAVGFGVERVWYSGSKFYYP